jgi:hypothetical protein
MLRIFGQHTAVKNLLRVALMVTVSTATLLAPVAQANNLGDRLYAGRSLPAGDWLQSRNGRFVFVMQHDGNLVLYRTRDNRPLWSSGTYDRAVMLTILQTDGNLVLYGWDRRPIWASGSQGTPNTMLVMQDDGNAVIYRVERSSPSPEGSWGTPVFSTGTHGQF